MKKEVGATATVFVQKATTPLVNEISPVIKAMEGAIFSYTPPPEEQDRLRLLHGPSNQE